MKRNAPAKEVPSTDDIKNAGEFCFIVHLDAPDVHAGIIHACPCGCGAQSTSWFKGHGRGRPEWDVTGEWPNATLSPSIGIRTWTTPGGYHWHGYLRNGVFEEC